MTVTRKMTWFTGSLILLALATAVTKPRSAMSSSVSP